MQVALAQFLFVPTLSANSHVHWPWTCAHPVYAIIRAHDSSSPDSFVEFKFVDMICRLSSTQPISLPASSLLRCAFSNGVVASGLVAALLPPILKQALIVKRIDLPLQLAHAPKQLPRLFKIVRTRLFVFD